MDSNRSFSVVASTLAAAASVTAPPLAPFYLVPVVVLTREPAVIRAECGRRVVSTWNSDGHAYSLDELAANFGKSAGLEQWRKAVPIGRMERPPVPPTVKTREEDKDDEMLVRITKTLVNLLEDHEVQLPFRRRLRNAKLSRSAVIWMRVVKKALLLLRNNRAPVGDLLSEHKPYL